MKKLLIAVTACSALALTGCGGSDDSKAEPDAGALSKSEFIKQAEAICTAAEKRLDAVGETFKDPANPTMEELTKALEEYAVPEFEKVAKELRELEAPKADAKEVEAMLAALDTAVAKIKAEPMALVDEATRADANAKFAAYGVDGCAD